MTPLAQSSLLLGLYAGILLLAALQDIVQLRISNYIVLLLLAVTIIGIGMTAPAGDWWRHLASFVLTLGVGTFLFARGWLGGGDTKLLAASALAFPLAGLLWFVTSVAILGGLVTLLLLVVRRVAPARRAGDDGIEGGRRSRSVPYGVAIAAGAILTAFYGPAGPLSPPAEPPVYLQPIEG